MSRTRCRWSTHCSPITLPRTHLPSCCVGLEDLNLSFPRPAFKFHFPSFPANCSIHRAFPVTRHCWHGEGRPITIVFTLHPCSSFLSINPFEGKSFDRHFDRALLNLTVFNDLGGSGSVPIPAAHYFFFFPLL